MKSQVLPVHKSYSIKTDGTGHCVYGGATFMKVVDREIYFTVSGVPGRPIERKSARDLCLAVDVRMKKHHNPAAAPATAPAPATS
jgi:hypothetical protein